LERVSGEEVAAALRAVAINPLFGLECGPPAEADRWIRASQLCNPADPTLGKLIRAIGLQAGARERRVAASLTVMGYATRLVTPAVGVLLHKGLVLDLHPGVVWWRYRIGDGFRLRLPAPAAWRCVEADRLDTRLLFERWCRVLIDGHLGHVVDAARRVEPVARGLLWGNVASSLAGSLRAMALHGLAPLTKCLAAGTALLGHGPLAGTGTMATRSGQLVFVRRSCCLYYRLPGGGLCGDCALLDRAKP
jgi:ferric iron reductase protein FhuF